MVQQRIFEVLAGGGKGFGRLELGSTTSYLEFNETDGQLNLEDIDIHLGDNDIQEYGDATGGDVSMRFDGTDFDVLANADDTVWKWGTGTKAFDMWWYGDIADHYILWDASTQTLSLEGQARTSKMNTLSPRYELRWIAGARGKPAINADIRAAAEATRMIADPYFEILGGGASSGSTAHNAEGGIRLTTGGTNGDGVFLLPHLDGDHTSWTKTTWGTDKETIWECHIKTGSSISNCIIWAGLKLTNTDVSATDADQVYFRYENAITSGNWVAISSVADSDTLTDTGITVATSTEYHLKIVIGSDRVAKMYINGVLEATSSALTDTTDFIPYICVEEDGASSALTLDVYGQAISRVMG